MTPIFVLVHGAFCNSASWLPLQRELALLGHRSLAVDLPGHGFPPAIPAAYQVPQDPAVLATVASPLADVRLADNVGHVVETVRQVAAHGPVVLVGHSRGGLTITGVGNAVPELVSRIVYVSAWCCVDLTPREYEQEPEHGPNPLVGVMSLAAADPAEIGAIRINWRAAGPDEISALRAALFADGTDDEVRAFINVMDTDENLDVGGADDRAQAGTWGRIPRTYVRLTEDKDVPIALQDRFIAEADRLTPDNPFDVRAIRSSHLKALVHPAELARTLVDAAAQAQETAAGSPKSGK
ncbi:alpha/beta hydrolase [Fodinicola acaciae]|uniref:alpha/beta hydrolase n=1 Tax=Fodinicola acaciae TaxID=2681555 RepID=UPI0013D03A29|nr:alpha/beta fold hydrolase [Fodinicola acaciae]